MPRVLVVDDESGVRESLRMLLGDHCEVVTLASVDTALAAIDDELPDLVIADLVMPGRDGFELIEELRGRENPPPVMVVSATHSIGTAVDAMQRGAADYVTKPFDAAELRVKVKRLLEHSALAREVASLRAQLHELDGDDTLHELRGRSPAMRKVFQTIRRVADTRASVLVCGESGTGKELVARALHAQSSRADAPLVAVNCAAIPDDLIESELFGHERGAFTGASDRLIGKFELASGGTLFLDEIGELGSSVQSKLLRALQERQVERLGGSSSIPIDVRVIVATNRNLERDVAEGRFRDDLFYRINVIRIELPPLRERAQDVRLLANHLLALASLQNPNSPRSFSSEALAALDRYPWPGNVRELGNAVEHAVALAEGEVAELEDLPQVVVGGGRIAGLREDVRFGRLGFEEAVSGFERDLLLEALERADWNQTRAARALSMTRRSLKLRIDRLELKRPG